MHAMINISFLHHLPAKIQWGRLNTALGTMRFAITTAPVRLCHLSWQDSRTPANVKVFPTANDAVLTSITEAITTLVTSLIAAHPLPSMELECLAVGTPFQHAVWQELLRVPRGDLISYSELAQRIGNPLAVRAIGQAMKNNPLALIIPCHRVISASGSIGGYNGGIERKRLLLASEKTHVVENIADA